MRCLLQQQLHENIFRNFGPNTSMWQQSLAIPPSVAVPMLLMAFSSWARKAISVANFICVPLSTSMKCEWFMSIDECFGLRGFSTRYCAAVPACQIIEVLSCFICTSSS